MRNFQKEVTDSAAPHPWEAAISDLCPSIQFGVPIHAGAPTSFADGRCFGKPFSHQRWDEFIPQRFIKSMLTGAITNTGLRDAMQKHKYMGGEFSATGYHAAPTGFKLGVAEGTEVRFAPSLAVQDFQSMWGFDGSWPPKMLLVRYGEPFLFRLYNGLPLALDSNRGFGDHFITVSTIISYDVILVFSTVIDSFLSSITHAVCIIQRTINSLYICRPTSTTATTLPRATDSPWRTRCPANSTTTTGR